MSATITSANTVDIKMECDNEKSFTMKIDNPRNDLTWNQIFNTMIHTIDPGDSHHIQIYDKDGNAFTALSTATKTETTTSKEFYEPA